jgi:nicotinamidase-related amidase
MTSTLAPEDRLSRPALVVVDMQNDFVRAGAPLEVPEARATIPAHRLLLEAFRRRDLPVVYTKFVTGPTPTLLWEWSPQCRPPTRCCWKGHRRFYPDVQQELECTEIIGELRAEPDDLVIEKRGYGAFHDTPLAGLLRGRSVQSLVVTGTVTQICVEETAREAFHHGFRTMLCADAVSSYAPDLHAATLRNFAMKFGWVEPSTTLTTLLA